jgi:soluble cytochrome b562
MKRISILATVAVMAVACNQQDQSTEKAEHTEASAKKEKSWKEMDEFHTTLSGTFHPAESGNLQPVKDSAQVLVSRAETWKSGSVPEGYDAVVAAPLLARLSAQATVLQGQVQQAAADSVLTIEITKLHDIYHEIAEKCNAEEHH